MADKPRVRGDRLQRLREGQNYTQGQVAMRSGVDRSLISRIERGVRPNVYVATVGALARALNTTTDYLLDLTANPWSSDNTTEPTSELEWKLLEEFRKLTEAEQPIAVEQVRLIIRLREASRAYIVGGEADEGEQDEGREDGQV